MEPQQRIILEQCWHCLEDAQIKPSTIAGRSIGVFIGAFNYDYKELFEREGSKSCRPPLYRYCDICD